MTEHNDSVFATAARQRMMRLLRREITDEAVLRAMASVPRERFVPHDLWFRAYDDSALPIGEGQTISQPLIVALMTQALRLQPEDRVLEVGTGSGYQSAVLSRLARAVVTVERREALLERARVVLAELECDKVAAHLAGVVLGWPEDAPYDAIIVTAGAPHVPRRLLDQLAEGGRLVIPVGSLRAQQMVRATKTQHGVELVRLGPCGFVPLIGRDAWSSDTTSNVSERMRV